MLPDKNNWAVIGAVGTSAVVFLLTALTQFFATGQAWPADLPGWEHILIPPVVAGALAALVPRYSNTERKLGFRKTGPRDAPVLNTASEHFRGKLNQ